MLIWYYTAMNKKLMISLLTLMLLVVTLFFAHRHFTKEVMSVNQTLFLEQIGYSQLQENIKSIQNVQAYFFCEQNNDCNYVSYSLIKPILNKYQLPFFSSIIFVNMDDVSRQVSSTRLKELYNIQSVPAIVLIDPITQSVISTLEYNKSNPLTQSIIEEWLLTNGLLR